MQGRVNISWTSERQCQYVVSAASVAETARVVETWTHGRGLSIVFALGLVQRMNGTEVEKRRKGLIRNGRRELPMYNSRRDTRCLHNDPSTLGTLADSYRSTPCLIGQQSSGQWWLRGGDEKRKGEG